MIGLVSFDWKENGLLQLLDLARLIEVAESQGADQVFVYNVDTGSDGYCLLTSTQELTIDEAEVAASEWTSFADPAQAEDCDGVPYSFDTAQFVYEVPSTGGEYVTGLGPVLRMLAEGMDDLLVTLGAEAGPRVEAVDCGPASAANRARGGF